MTLAHPKGPSRRMNDLAVAPLFTLERDAIPTHELPAEHFTVFDVSNALRERGWLVPAYTFPENRTDLAALRVVVKRGFGHDLADLLIGDLERQLPRLQKQPAPVHDESSASALPPLVIGSPGRRGDEPPRQAREVEAARDGRSAADPGAGGTRRGRLRRGAPARGAARRRGGHPRGGARPRRARVSPRRLLRRGDAAPARGRRVGPGSRRPRGRGDGTRPRLLPDEPFRGDP